MSLANRTIDLASQQVLVAADGTAAAPSITNDGDKNTGMFFPAADTIAFSEGGVESMRIDSSGNVGIGTTTPAAKLDVVGSLGVRVNEDGAGTKVVQLRSNYSSLGPAVQVTTNDPLLFLTNNTERLRIDSSGNVGIGNTSPASYNSSGDNLVIGNAGDNGITIVSGTDGKGYLFFADGVSGANAYAGQVDFDHSVNALKFGVLGTERLRIDSSGRVGIGTSSPATAYRMSLTGDGSTIVGGLSLTSAGITYIGAPSANSSAFEIWNAADNYVRIGTNNTERLRITGGGDVYIGRTIAGGFGKLQVDTSVSSDWAQYNTNSASTEPRGIRIRHTGATPNNTSAYFIWCEDVTRERFYVASNGGVYNFSANNANLSDERLKTDIQPSPSYLSKICSIPVVNFKFKDQTHNDYNLGVIAQQVEAVCPELVDVDGFGETPEDGVPLKAIYQTDLQYALMKCVQELKAENDSLKARIEALEAA